MEEHNESEIIVENANTAENESAIKKTAKTGISFGCALAMVISYTNWHSVGWAIIHGLMSWVYVIYYVLQY
jgi:hypothetical protein